MPNSEESLERFEAHLAPFSLNTIVVNRKITFKVRIVYDLDIPDSWDDKCFLRSAEDNGESYSSEIQLTNSEAVERNDRDITITFELVPSNQLYDCFIDQGNDQLISTFQSFLITESMDSN